MKENALITTKGLDIIKVFSSTKSVEDLLATLRKDAEVHVPDVKTKKGRDDIASNAYRVSRSKTAIEKEGKKLGADWLKKKKRLDADLRLWREGCDKIRDDVRQPLTDYENAEKARIEQIAKEKEYELDWDEAHEIQDLLIREAEVKRKEKELADKEAARLEEEKKAQLIKEQKEREEQIAKEAADKAKKAAEEKAAAEKAKAEAAILKARQEKERAIAEKAAQEKQIEADRIQAEKDKKAAIAQAKKDAEDEAKRKEMARKEKAAAVKAEADQKAADVEHQREINNIVYDSLVRVCKLSQSDAKIVVRKVATGQVRNLKIEY